MSIHKTLSTGMICLILAACSANGPKVDPDESATQNWSAQQIYNEARENLNDGNYTRAVKLYEILSARYPNGRFAEQSMLDSAYAYYRDEEPQKALAVLREFRRRYPQHVNMDYALYLQALVLLNEDQSFLNRLASQDWADRDPKANREAYIVFAQIVERYPNSKYAPEAAQYMSKLVDALAGNEMAIARYYMQRGAYVAAVNRAQDIIRHYRNTRHIEEALAISELAYQRLNKPKLSEDARRVLQQNFPNSPYLQQEWKKNSGPWWGYWQRGVGEEE